MTFEKTTRNPLIDYDSNHEAEQFDTVIDVVNLLSLFDGLEEESLEGLQRVLVHMVNDP